MLKTSRLRENYVGPRELRGPHVWDKPGLSGHLVRLVSLMQPNKPDRPNGPNEQDRLADFFSISLGETAHTITQALGGPGEQTRFMPPPSADQEVGPKADSREHGDAQHHLLMPAHPRLCLANRQGTHDCHRGLLWCRLRSVVCETIRRSECVVNADPVILSAAVCYRRWMKQLVSTCRSLRANRSYEASRLERPTERPPAWFHPNVFGDTS